MDILALVRKGFVVFRLHAFAITELLFPSIG
jgi:hypothetical protein